MGVKDISILIKKYAPSAVTRVPGSLSVLAGKTFAIDANLLTTKFFHAELNLDDRQATPPTLRSWYRFLQVLERQNIKPIVVFDGDSRVLAKAAEVRRRVDARGLQRDRGSAEADRSSRLAELSDVWSGGALGFSDRIAVVEAFRETIVTGERFVQLDGEDENSLRRMIELHDAFKADESNPIYSANQRKITAVERAFYDENVDSEVSRNELEEGRLQSTFLQKSHQNRSLSLPTSSLLAVRVSPPPISSFTVLTSGRSISWTQWEYHGTNHRWTSRTRPRESARRCIREGWRITSCRRIRTSQSTAHHFYVV